MRSSLAIALATLVACGVPDDDHEGEPPVHPEADAAPIDPASRLPVHAPADWTVFVYGHADHNLTPSLADDLREMAAARLDGKVHVVVMADWDGSQPDHDTGTEWYLVTGSGATPELLLREPEMDLDDPVVLSDAIAAAFTAFPAERRLLVLWDHGGAWRAGYGGDHQDGARTEPDGLDLVELTGAIRRGLAGAGLQGDRPLELLAFDTCLMAGVEILSEMSDLAEIIVANAEVDYGPGWDYAAAFTWIAEHPAAPLAELAVAESLAWEKHHVASEPVEGLLRAHAAIDTRKWDAFAASYADFVDAWVASGGTGLGLARSVHESVPGYWLSDFRKLANPAELRDVGQFLARVARHGTPAASLAAESALEKLEAAIVARSLGTLRSGQSGVHLALPALAGGDEEMLADYRAKAPRWVAQTGWDRGLARLYQIADGKGPELTREIVPGASTRITVRSEAADIADAAVQVIATSGTDKVRLGLVAMAALAPNVSATFYWEPSAFTLPDGAGGKQMIYLTSWSGLRSPGPGALPRYLQITAQLGDGTSRFPAQLLVDTETFEVSLVALTIAQGYTSVIPLAELTEMTVRPRLPTRDNLNWKTGSDFPIDGRPIALDVMDLPAGDVEIWTLGWDLTGEQTLFADSMRVGP